MTQRLVAPDDRIGTYDSWSAREGNPVHLLTDDEQNALDDLIEGVAAVEAVSLGALMSNDNELERLLAAAPRSDEAAVRLLESLQTGWQPKREEIDPAVPQRDLRDWGF